MVSGLERWDVAGRFQYSFDPHDAIPLGDLGTVYRSARVMDEWGVLIVESGGLLLRRRGGSIRGVAVPPPREVSDPPRRGEVWRLGGPPTLIRRSGATSKSGNVDRSVLHCRLELTSESRSQVE